MKCFCGCEAKVSGRRAADLNLQAARIALELLAWDKARAAGKLGPPAADDAERLLAQGADSYRRLIATLHGEDGSYALEEGEEWLKRSEAERRHRDYMTKKASLLERGSRLLLTEEDTAQLDRRHPERSFSGAAGRPTGGRGDDREVTSQLERLGALHAEGVLTDEEFAAAKARVLGLV